jgi:fluoride exporter
MVCDMTSIMPTRRGHRRTRRAHVAAPGHHGRRGVPSHAVDSDPAPRPLHLRPRLVALVALGGAVGTGARAMAEAWAGADGGWPWATWVVNLTGAFALGMLLERLARTGPDDGRRRDVRLAVGTGALGGFTTYSTLALDAVTLATAGDVGASVAYAVSTLALGVVAAAAGMVAGARLRRSPGADRAGSRAHPAGRIP